MIDILDIPLVEIDLNIDSGQFQPMECLSLIVNPHAWRGKSLSGNPP